MSSLVLAIWIGINVGVVILVIWVDGPEEGFRGSEAR